MTWSYWNSGCASLGVAPEKRCNPKEMRVWVRDGLVKFPRFTWFLDIFGEVYLENCSLKQITDGLVAFWVIKKKPCETECFTGNSWLWEKIVNLLVSPPFSWGGGVCKEIVCFQCGFNWVGIYYNDPTVGSRIPTHLLEVNNRSEKLLFLKSGFKHHRFGWGWSDPIILHRRFQGFRMIIRRSGKKWCKFWSFEKVLGFLWTTSLSRWCGSYQM